MIKAFQLFDILVVERVPVSYSLFLTNLALEGPASYRGENRVKPLHVEYGNKVPQTLLYNAWPNTMVTLPREDMFLHTSWT
jgi:hypothetical protein